MITIHMHTYEFECKYSNELCVGVKIQLDPTGHVREEAVEY